MQNLFGFIENVVNIVKTKRRGLNLTKQQLAIDIIEKLDPRHIKEVDWVTDVDTTLRGQILFKIKGMEKPLSIQTSGDHAVKDPALKVAESVVREGFHYGVCDLYISDPKAAELSIQKSHQEERNRQWSELLKNATNEVLSKQISEMTINEKLEDIKKKYGIEVLSFNDLSDQ